MRKTGQRTSTDSHAEQATPANEGHTDGGGRSTTGESEKRQRAGGSERQNTAKQQANLGELLGIVLDIGHRRRRGLGEAALGVAC